MQYKIVEKQSGEVLVYAKRIKHESLSGGDLWAVNVINGNCLTTESWDRVAGPFVCWKDAEDYVKGQRYKQHLDTVVREEIIDV